MALNDRLLTEARNVPDPRDDDGVGKMLALEITRTTHIFRLLEDDCKSQEAKDSLMVGSTLSSDGLRLIIHRAFNGHMHKREAYQASFPQLQLARRRWS
jgi:hypothetical protein